tara:strand:- start:252 stop:398 length:147 start_codon:yes stop_codon:yes gene_type:complete
MSGAHYSIEEEEEEVVVKPKMVCSYSGLPSVLSYVNHDTKRQRHGVNR